MSENIENEANNSSWLSTTNKTISSTVSIHYWKPCSFDTELAHNSQASGFVVDTERGLILTNRHVAGPGPFRGYCQFKGYDEVCVAML